MTSWWLIYLHLWIDHSLSLSLFKILSCSRATCTSSIMHIGNAAVEARKSDLVLEHAKDFLDQYFTSIKRWVHSLSLPFFLQSKWNPSACGSSSSAAHETRWKQVRQCIESTGHYQLTETELIYGAKLAWRNSSRCIGRIQWSKLQVSSQARDNPDDLWVW